jgi:hypothetical protein
VSNRTHALNSALHTGDLPAARVLNANSGQFTDATTYTIGKASPSGVTLLVGHDGTNPLVSNTSRIFDHNHSGTGFGGKINYADLNNIPTTFNPATHAASHAVSGTDSIVSDTLACTVSVSGYTPSAGTVAGHLGGISTQLAAFAYDFMTVAYPSTLSEVVGAPMFLLGTSTLGPAVATGKSKTLVELSVTFGAAVSSSSQLTVVAKNITQNTTATVTVTPATNGGKYNAATPSLVFAPGDLLCVYTYSNGTASTNLRCGTVSLKFQQSA